MTLRRLTHTARDFATITAELEAITREVGPEFWTDFFQTNLGEALINLAALVGDTVSYGQDALAQEMWLATCRRLESALRFAKSVGYRPRAATAAVVTVTARDLPTALVAVGGTIPAGAKITGANGLPYELLQAVTVPAGAGSVKLTLREGVSYTEEFAPSAIPNQTITTSNPIVEEDSWVLYVGTPSPSNLWANVDNVDLETGPTQTYSTEIDAKGRLIFRFGNGASGKIPDQTVTAAYRKTSGAIGNSATGTVKGNIVVNLVSSGTVSLSFENTDEPDNTQTEYSVPSESGGLTIAAAAQTGTLTYSPLVAGSVQVTFNLPTPGDKIIIKDNGAGGFAVTTATGTVAAIAIISSSISYTSANWTVTFSSPLLAGGTIDEAYNAYQAANVAGLISGSASGGVDRETVDEMRRNIPAYLAAQRRVVTLRDFVNAVETLTAVARAYADAVAASYTGNFVRTSVWQYETVNFTVVATDGVTSTVPYRRYKSGEVDLAQTVSDFLRERTMVTVNNIVALPAMLWLDVYFNLVYYDPSFDADTVHANFVAAIVGVFQDADGFNIRISDLINAARNVDGVRYFTLDRIGLGTQAYSSEPQSATTVSATVGGTLTQNFSAGAIVSPGSVIVTVDQPSGTITCQDNGSGSFVVTAGTRTITGSAIDYNTGIWSITFAGGTLSPARPVIASYSDLTNDYRSTQLAIIDDPYTADQYPPPGIVTANEPLAPPYFDGKPKTVIRAGVDVTASPPYMAGDESRYDPIKDISAPLLAGAVHFYNDQYYYNNEILYDSITGVSPAVRTINLRKLAFTLVKSS